MELQLQKKTYSCYEPAAPLCETREAAAETIVPDYCPDIAHIIDANGCLTIRSKELTDGRVSVSGAIKMTLLYMAEGNGGVKSFEYTIPLEESFDGRLPQHCSDVCLDARLAIPEVRAINPRKIYTRVGVSFRLTPYCRSELVTCGAIETQEDYGIRTLCEDQEICIVKAVKEKDFTFIENIALSGAKEGIREILCTKTQLRVTDSKAVGGKVLLKGIACAEILYCSLNGEICRESAELPFSQLIDGIADDASIYAEACVRLTGSEYRIGSENAPDDMRTIGVKLFMNAFVVLREMITTRAISDLYSTSHELSAEMRGVELCRESSTMVKEQSIREQIETGTEAAEILSSEVVFTQSSISVQEGSAKLHAGAVMKILYLDEGGVPFCVERRCEISTSMELPENCSAVIEDICCGEMRASALGNGIEVRFSALFTVSISCHCHCSCLCSLQVQPREEESGSVPSLVLKPLQKGQRLWDVAKQYRTTVEDILSANELEDESELNVGEVLLIPRKR